MQLLADPVEQLRDLVGSARDADAPIPLNVADLNALDLVLAEIGALRSVLAAPVAVDLAVDPHGRIVASVSGRGAPISAPLDSATSAALAAQVIGAAAATAARRLAGLVI